MTTSDSNSEESVRDLSPERYKMLVENVEDYAIFLLDANGVIATWNKGAEKNKGYRANEIIGKHFSTFYLEKDRLAKKPERELELATKFGRVEDEDWRVRKDGTRFWANVVITALFDDEQNLVGFAKVTRDLSERKKHEDDLRQANEQLRIQQKHLEHLNSVKDEFVLLASHQLRTPATIIKMCLGMILEGFIPVDEPAAREYIQKAYDSNGRQVEIVESLLRVAQIDTGALVLDKETRSVSTFMQKIVEENQSKVAERDQTISFHCDEDIEAHFDESSIYMAVDNIIDNASKYSSELGEIAIDVTRDDRFAWISIADNGVGVDINDLDKLFEKFVRIQNEYSDESSGTGLGLYWAKNVIELHGGTIKVDSQLGKGTTFEIGLPLGV